jgi:16S rRNA (guanine966-N2)-methyltransferase
MRITGGEFRSRILLAPEGTNVRPTSDKTRQAIFNILIAGRWKSEADFDLDGIHVLDLFCGTGAMGLEALSRGAASCSFIDRDKTSLSFAQNNARKLGVEGQVNFILKDATKPGPKPAPMPLAGLVFIDPPYRHDLAVPALAAAAENGWLAPAAVAVIESEKARQADGLEDLPFDLLDSRAYGGTLIRIVRFSR